MKKLVSFLLTVLVVYSCSTSKRSASSSTSPIRVVMVGGGASHDFNRWYRQADVATLSRDAFATVTYTAGMDSVLPLLASADVLYLTNNQPMADPALRKAIFDFAASGKGLVVAHAATWYNWKDWPEYNNQLVGGGSRGHERYGQFEVTVTNTRHPITQGVETKFTLKDELYRIQVDSTGPGIEVLAIATIPGTQTTYPQLWITKNSKSRIVGFTLGHDADSHDIANYQNILRNSIKWAAHR